MNHLSPEDDCIDVMTGETMILISRPTQSGQLIAIYRGGALKRIHNDGVSVTTGDILAIKRPDIMIEAHEKWNALGHSARYALKRLLEVNGKITAINALRELTGLGLVQAKRAIEEFTA